VSTDVSKEHIASIFRIEKIEQEATVKAGGRQLKIGCKELGWDWIDLAPDRILRLATVFCDVT
jgi:hypothetical protein